MEQNDLKSILQAEIDDAIGYIETETVDQRKQALEAYLRQPYGNEVEGKSQIVTGEVAEAIDGALPSLVRIFTGSDNIVVFEPQGPQDEASAAFGWFEPRPRERCRPAGSAAAPSLIVISRGKPWHE